MLFKKRYCVTPQCISRVCFYGSGIVKMIPWLGISSMGHGHDIRSYMLDNRTM